MRRTAYSPRPTEKRLERQDQELVFFPLPISSLQSGPVPHSLLPVVPRSSWDLWPPVGPLEPLAHTRARVAGRFSGILAAPTKHTKHRQQQQHQRSACRHCKPSLLIASKASEVLQQACTSPELVDDAGSKFQVGESAASGQFWPQPVVAFRTCCPTARLESPRCPQGVSTSRPGCQGGVYKRIQLSMSSWLFASFF